MSALYWEKIFVYWIQTLRETENKQSAECSAQLANSPRGVRGSSRAANLPAISLKWQAWSLKFIQFWTLPINIYFVMKILSFLVQIESKAQEGVTWEYTGEVQLNWIGTTRYPSLLGAFRQTLDDSKDAAEDRDRQQRYQVLGDSQRQCECALIVTLEKQLYLGHTDVSQGCEDPLCPSHTLH